MVARLIGKVVLLLVLAVVSAEGGYDEVWEETTYEERSMLRGGESDGRHRQLFSWTNLLYHIHWCKTPDEKPIPGPLGCKKPTCTGSSSDPQYCSVLLNSTDSSTSSSGGSRWKSSKSSSSSSGSSSSGTSSTGTTSDISGQSNSGADSNPNRATAIANRASDLWPYFLGGTALLAATVLGVMIHRHFRDEDFDVDHEITSTAGTANTNYVQA